MNSINQRQLRSEKLVLERLINRFGEITLLSAHDNVVVALDFYRGAGIVKRLRNTKEPIDNEYLL